MIKFFENLITKKETEVIEESIEIATSEEVDIPKEIEISEEIHICEEITTSDEIVESQEIISTAEITDCKEDDDSTLLFATSLPFFQFSQSSFSKDISNNNSNNAMYGNSSLSLNGPVLATKVAFQPKVEPKQEDITQKKIDSTVSDQVN